MNDEVPADLRTELLLLARRTELLADYLIVGRRTRDRSADAQREKIRPSIVSAVEAELAERNRRARYFDNDLLGDAFWMILLDLYANDARGKRVAVSELAVAANIRATTALRYLALLSERNMIERERSSSDRRVIYVGLTPNAVEQLEHYFAHRIGADRGP